MGYGTYICGIQLHDLLVTFSLRMWSGRACVASRVNGRAAQGNRGGEDPSRRRAHPSRSRAHAIRERGEEAKGRGGAESRRGAADNRASSPSNDHRGNKLLQFATFSSSGSLISTPGLQLFLFDCYPGNRRRDP